MIVTLIAPFSTTISFDRKWMAYEPTKVRGYFDREKANFGRSKVRLGRWLLPLSTPGAFYLDTEEPGALFREYFLATKKFQIDESTLFASTNWSSDVLTLTRPPEVSWLDKGFGCMTLQLSLTEDALHAQFAEHPQAHFDAMMNAFADRIFQQLRAQIEATTRLLFGLNYIHSTQDVPGTVSSAVSDSLHWVHKVWSLETDSDPLRLPHLITDRTLAHFDAARACIWGWADSIYIDKVPPSDAVIEGEWERGMLLAQYFHTILDHGIRQLPVQIEIVRLLLERGAVRQAQKEAEQFTYGINSLMTDFEIAKQLTAGSTREVLQSLTNQWETNKLGQGIVALLPYLRELVAQSSETLKSWSQTSIETILFFSTVIGFFGLSIALHDYLTPTKERFDLSKLALPHATIGDPLAIAGIFFLVSILIFTFSKVGVILRIVKSMQFQIKPLRRLFNSIGKSTGSDKGAI